MVECFVCNHHVNHVSNLFNHIKDTHPNADRKCERCNRLKNVIKENMIVNTFCSSCKDKKSCNKCKNYYNKYYIKNHQDNCKNRNAEYRTCKVCALTKERYEFYETKYTCKDCLNILEPCNICQKQIYKRNMKQHKLVHTKESDTNKNTCDRHCNKCKQIKNLIEFSLGKYTCKECLKERVICEDCGKNCSFRYIKEHTLKFHKNMESSGVVIN